MQTKPSFKVLYSNDMTNIETCTSPYHKKGEDFRQEMLEATVNETADTGVEVHLFQPGLGWVPFWKSQAYPFEEHIHFMKDKFGKDPSCNGFAKYMADGGDAVQTFIDSCRQNKQSPFISLRLNDGHGHDFINLTPEEIPDWAWLCFTPTHLDCSDWHIGDDLNDWHQRVLNWAIPEVPELKYQYIKEIAEQYDIDGFELDFMRYFSFFKPKEISLEARAQIMLNFIKKVRKVLDKTASPGQHRYLCVRVPAYIEIHDSLGIDLRQWVQAGVDMVNLSYHFFTAQEGCDLAAVRKIVPDKAALYVEMCHNTRVEEKDAFGYDNWNFRRTTPLQYYTTAHRAYARGFDGASIFNFVYYREYGTESAAPFNEPPFDILKHLGDKKWLAQQPQHYFMSGCFNDPPREWPLPKVFNAKQSEKFTIDMAPPQNGWKQDGSLRIQADKHLETSKWKATFNGIELIESYDRSEPYENPYPQLTGTAEEHRAWIIPVDILKDGYNDIEITLEEGSESKIVFLDIAVQ